MNERKSIAWSKDNFTCILKNTGEMLDSGHTRIEYQFSDNGKTIFSGWDFGLPYGRKLDLQAVFDLLGFLSLQEGDTDSEYFDSYTLEQLTWRNSSRCEELSLLVYDYENPE